jgi:hypothetical protein
VITRCKSISDVRLQQFVGYHPRIKVVPVSIRLFSIFLQILHKICMIPNEQACNSHFTKIPSMKFHSYGLLRWHAYFALASSFKLKLGGTTSFSPWTGEVHESVRLQALLWCALCERLLYFYVLYNHLIRFPCLYVPFQAIKLLISNLFWSVVTSRIWGIATSCTNFRFTSQERGMPVVVKVGALRSVAQCSFHPINCHDCHSGTAGLTALKSTRMGWYPATLCSCTFRTEATSCL